jgi:hypothetical protein
MPFGKYKGVEIADLPNNYLKWLKTLNLKGKLKEEVYKQQSGNRPHQYDREAYREQDESMSWNIWN